MEPAAGTGLLPYNFFLSPSPSWNLPELLRLSGSGRTVSGEGSNNPQHTHVRCVLSESGDAMGDTWICSAFFRAFLGLSPLFPWVRSSGEEIGENRGGSRVSSLVCLSSQVQNPLTGSGFWGIFVFCGGLILG